MADLVRAWGNTDRLVVADSYYASVESALKLKSMGLRFIGVVKTAIKGYPMQYLKDVPLLESKGSRLGVLTNDEPSNTQLCAFVWLDRERRYFISTSSSLAEGAPCRRIRYRQEDDVESNAEPIRKEITIKQPKAVEEYYLGNDKIDQHNRIRQSGLMFERKILTRDWSKRVNDTILSMCFVDAYLLAKGCRSEPIEMRDFFSILAEQLIDNKYSERETRSWRRRRQILKAREVEKLTTLHPSRQLTAPTPTKRRKKGNKKHLLQGRCMVCGKSTTHVCRECRNIHESSGTCLRKEFWICNKPGKVCMGKHIQAWHPNMIGKAREQNNTFFNNDYSSTML